MTEDVVLYPDLPLTHVGYISVTLLIVKQILLIKTLKMCSEQYGEYVY